MIIEEFPDHGPWRIDFIGRLKRNPQGNRDQLLISVHLTLLKENFKDPFAKSSVAAQNKNQKTIDVGFGFLPFLKIGSVWFNKRCIPNKVGSQTVIRIQPDSFEKKKIPDSITFNNKEYNALSNSHYPLGNHEQALKNEGLLFFKNKKRGKGHCRSIIIPQIEVFRFYYFTSSKMLDLLMYEGIEASYDHSLTYVSDKGDVYVKLIKSLNDADAWFIARYLTSHKMREQLVNFSRRWKMPSKHNIRSIDIELPYNDITQLEVIGKRIKHSSPSNHDQEFEQWSFLVTEIIKCSHNMGFNNVYVDRKNDGRQGENFKSTEVKQTNWTNTSSIYGGVDTNFNLSSKSEVNYESAKAQIDNYAKRFSYLNNKKLKKPLKQEQEYRSSQRYADRQEADSYNATNPSTTLGNVGEIGVQTIEEDKDTVDSSLLSFIKIIDSFCLIHNAQVKYLELNKLNNSSFDNSEITLSYFPSCIFGVRSWHKVKKRTRSIAIAELNLCEHFFYLLELERKKQEAFSTLLVYYKNYSQIHEHSFEELLITVAKKNRWPKQIETFDLVRQTVRHPRKELSDVKYAEDFIDSLQQKISKHIIPL